MEHIELVEKLREKTGLSYEECRAALEGANWDLLDAMIALEKAGKAGGSSARYSTRGSADSASAKAESKPKPEGESFMDLLRRFWAWLCRVGRGTVKNQLCLLDKDYKQVMSVPVLLFIVLLIFAFWAIVPLMIISLFFGCRYLFRGPDLGKESVNKVVGKATDIADSIKEEFRQSPDEEKKD